MQYSHRRRRLLILFYRHVVGRPCLLRTAVRRLLTARVDGVNGIRPDAHTDRSDEKNVP
jgi:hypothetical protein